MTSLRRLEHRHTRWLAERVSSDPAQHAFLASVLETAKSAAVSTSAGTLYGCFRGTEPIAAYWVGGSIIALDPSPESNEAAAAHLNRRGRYSCSLIGEAEAVLDLHHRLDWGTPLGVRAAQPLLVADRAPAVVPDASVRVGEAADIAVTFPASVAMFTEEVGFSPVENGSAAYMSRVRSLLLQRSTYLITTDTGPGGQPLRRWPADTRQQVVFKADLGIRSRQSVQVQGVWVHPDFRGAGLGATAMAAVNEHVRAFVAPIVSLYVNDYNAAARKTYERAGYSQVGTFATVMY